jgi:hypothetical protein
MKRIVKICESLLVSPRDGFTVFCSLKKKLEIDLFGSTDLNHIWTAPKCMFTENSEYLTKVLCRQ